MRLWKIYLAMFLLFLSYFGLFCSTLYIKVSVVQVFFFFLAALIGMIALSLAQDDGRERKEEHAQDGEE